MINIYLASGWFNPLQKKIMEEMYNVVRKLENEEKASYFAPFYNGIVLKRDDPKPKWREVFELDTKKIDTSDLMIANIEGFEPGTIFEVGYAYKANVPVIAYSSVFGRGLNLMLSYSCIGFANSPEQLKGMIDNFIQSPNRKEKIKEWEGEPI